jgi:hypothetical protein
MRGLGGPSYRLTKSVALCAATLVLLACRTQPPMRKGDLEVTIRSLASRPVNEVLLTVQAPGVLDIPVSMPLPFTADQSTTLIRNLPVGTDYAVSVAGYGDEHALVAQGLAIGVVIRRGTITRLVVYLNDPVGPAPFVNHGPLIDSLTLSAEEIAPGGTITLAATAHDPDPGQTAGLELTWQPLDGCGTIEGTNMIPGADAWSPSVSTAVWTAPANVGNCQVALTARDPLGLANSVTFTLRVLDGAGTGSAEVALVFNDAPNILAITAAPAQLSSTAPTTGLLTAIVVDPEGDRLGYTWSAAPDAPCTVVFDDPTAASTSFTAIPAGPDATYCTFMVQVNNGSWSDTGQAKNHAAAALVLAITNPLVVQLPPRFGIGYQSTDTVSAGTMLIVGATAFDPSGGVLAYAWSASTSPEPAPQSPPLLGLDPSFTTAATWMVPEGNLVTADSYEISVTATSSSSQLSSTARFALTHVSP